MSFLKRAAAVLQRPAPRPVVALLALAILAAPAWLMWDSLEYYALYGDDFWYISEGRDASTLTRYLLEPHNTHIVPLFRLWTFALMEAAGRMARWQSVFAVGAYLPVILAMLGVGHLVARERRSRTLGLAAMVLLGVTTTLEPAVAWFSAGQALGSGVAIVAALIAARAWRERGGWIHLVGLFTAVLAAPLLWSGGLAAGPAVAAFLAVEKRRACRRLAWIVLVPTLVSALAIVVLSQRPLTRTKIIHEVHPDLWPRPIQAVLHTTQAIPEVLVIGNLGLDAETTPAQGLVLTIALLLAWARSWWRKGGPTPLAVAGASVVLFSYLMVYYFRGNLPFATHMRPLRWYHAVPQVGAVLFALGWGPRAESSKAESRVARPTNLGLIAVLALLVSMLALHVPRHQRRMIEAAPPVTEFEYEVTNFRTPWLQYLRARYFAEQHAARQRRALARLDLAEVRAASEGIGRDALKDAFGAVFVPGMPKVAEAYNAIDLFRLPARGRPASVPDLRREFGEWLAPEPEPRPDWLLSHPQAPWPPPNERSVWVGGD
jgi:hypothetical protein